MTEEIFAPDDYKILFYSANEIDEKILSYLRMNLDIFLQSRGGSAYANSENYIWDTTNKKTFAYLIEARLLQGIYFVYKNARLVSISGCTLNSSGIFFGGSRRISALFSPREPYHLAYVIRHQVELARKLKCKAFVVPYNCGIRTAYYISIKKMAKAQYANLVFQKAQELLNEGFQFEDGPVNCRFTEQHLVYKILDAEFPYVNLFSCLNAPLVKAAQFCHK